MNRVRYVPHSILHKLPGLFLLSNKRNVCSSYLDGIGMRDKYGGMRINLSEGNISTREFIDHLTNACSCRPPPFPAIWVTVPSDKFSIVPSLCLDPPEGPGLQFHHAAGKSATLTRWLDDGPSKIPEYATHQLGVAGVLTNPEQTHILMVRERSGSRFPGWKFPTGLTHLGENIEEAVLREVYEECHVSAVFAGVIAFRQQHRHPSYFDRSDLLIICRLNLPSGTTDLPKIRPCQKELSDSKWMLLSELKSAQVHSVLENHNLRRIADAKEEIHITTITKKVVDLINHESIRPYVEFRSEHLQSILRDCWYDLFLPYIREGSGKNAP
ncbi:Nucleoside diphosphate-linked moiety X motif 6 [Fasciola gigantica]|uniref:Nucleoside diphosphate-linked moiety X motif 6 n=1 Tax=Fasciola gigantica TaxID=46835 RepID=A0A504YYH4_FASGI|nr:Nucleoside diphosphate-linked moiety X motif 6 [Fasciola gigantica]